MSEEKVKQEIIDKIDMIAKAIVNGKDIEIKTSANGIRILIVAKKKI